MQLLFVGDGGNVHLCEGGGRSPHSVGNGCFCYHSSRKQVGPETETAKASLAQEGTSVSLRLTFWA